MAQFDVPTNGGAVDDITADEMMGSLFGGSGQEPDDTGSPYGDGQVERLGLALMTGDGSWVGRVLQLSSLAIMQSKVISDLTDRVKKLELTLQEVRGVPSLVKGVVSDQQSLERHVASRAKSLEEATSEALREAKDSAFRLDGAMKFLLHLESSNIDARLGDLELVGVGSAVGATAGTTSDPAVKRGLMALRRDVDDLKVARCPRDTNIEELMVTVIAGGMERRIGSLESWRSTAVLPRTLSLASASSGMVTPVMTAPSPPGRTATSVLQSMLPKKRQGRTNTTSI
jgi:hypothetical protein